MKYNYKRTIYANLLVLNNSKWVDVPLISINLSLIYWNTFHTILIYVMSFLPYGQNRVTVNIYVYIYIYIERERERVREHKREDGLCVVLIKWNHAYIWLFKSIDIYISSSLYINMYRFFLTTIINVSGIAPIKNHSIIPRRGGKLARILCLVTYCLPSRHPERMPTCWKRPNSRI